MRLTIIIHKSLSIGLAMNATAVLSAHMGQRHEGIISHESLIDHTGVEHASVATNIVILKAKATSHLTDIIQIGQKEQIPFSIFTSQGQCWNNNFAAYRNDIASQDVSSLNVIGVAILTCEHALTKRFSLYS